MAKLGLCSLVLLLVVSTSGNDDDDNLTNERQRKQQGLPDGFTCDGRVRPVSPGYVQVEGQPQILFTCTEKSRPVVTPPQQPFQNLTTASTAEDTTTTAETTTTADEDDEVTTDNVPVPTTTPKIDDAICQINMHPTNSITDGQCTSQTLDFVRLNASVGFNNQLCTEYTTTASHDGADTVLYMTIQPLCKDDEDGPQHWSVCSWQPDESSSFCSQADQQCCDRIVPYIDSFIPQDVDRSLLACQDYISVADVNAGLDDGTSTCQFFYGWNGTHPQTYAFELLQCSGGVPSDPDCNQNSASGGLLNQLLSSDSTNNTTSVFMLASVGVGCGLLLFGIALRLRRNRLGYTNLNTKLSQQQQQQQQQQQHHHHHQQQQQHRHDNQKKPKHQFVDWIGKSTAALPDTETYQYNTTTNRRDFNRLYENLDSNSNSTSTPLAATSSTSTITSTSGVLTPNQQSKSQKQPQEKSALLACV